MKVRALLKYYYDRHEYQPGDVFEMDDRLEHPEFMILSHIGTLERVNSAAPEPSLPQVPPDVEPPTKEMPPEPKPTDTKVRPMRRYRRNMTAQN